MTSSLRLLYSRPFTRLDSFVSFREVVFPSGIFRSFCAQNPKLVNGVPPTQQSSENHKDDGTYLTGQLLDLAADLRTFRPGDKLDIPYELTVSESMQDFWQSVRFRF